MKPSVARNRRIPSPFTGLQGEVLIFVVLVETGT